jgi:putative FmdB family regulatory protein
MAFYTYECGNCGNEFNVRENMSEHSTDVRECKYCHVKEAEQILFPSMLEFKGSGFYETTGKGKEKAWK